MRVEAAWKDLYPLGGVCLLINGIVFSIPWLIMLSFPQTSTGAEALTMMAENSLLFRTVAGIFALVAILFVPGMLALYLSLRSVKKTHMLVATALFAVAVALFLASTVMEYSLIGFSARYVAASSEAQRAAYVAVLDLVNEGTAVADTLGMVLFSISLLIVASVMLKGRFGKPTAYLSILAGILGLVGVVPGLFVVSVASNLLLALWFLAVGYSLYKLG